MNFFYAFVEYPTSADRLRFPVDLSRQNKQVLFRSVKRNEKNSPLPDELYILIHHIGG